MRKRSEMSTHIANEWKSNPLNENLQSEVSTIVTDAPESSAQLPEAIVHETHSKLSMEIFPDKTFFVSDSKLTGIMDLHCTAKKHLKIRQIQIELRGIEQVADCDAVHGLGLHPFLHRTIVYLAPELPPCDAVKAEERADHLGFWEAKCGESRFQFGFDLPPEIPSSIVTKQASVHYILTASVHFKHAKSHGVLKISRPVPVMQKWSSPDLAPSVANSTSKVWGVFGGKGNVEMDVTLNKSLFPSGCHLFTQLRISNDSAKRVKNVKLTLIRRVKTFRLSDDGSLTPIVFKREPIVSKLFKSSLWNFDGCNKRWMLLDFQIPTDMVTVKNAKTLEISYVLQVAAQAPFAKDLIAEVPFDVCHSSSINTQPKSLGFIQAQIKPIELVHEPINQPGANPNFDSSRKSVKDAPRRDSTLSARKSVKDEPRRDSALDINDQVLDINDQEFELERSLINSEKRFASFTRHLPPPPPIPPRSSIDDVYPEYEIENEKSVCISADDKSDVNDQTPTLEDIDKNLDAILEAIKSI